MQESGIETSSVEESSVEESESVEEVVERHIEEGKDNSDSESDDDMGYESFDEYDEIDYETVCKNLAEFSAEY